MRAVPGQAKHGAQERLETRNVGTEGHEKEPRIAHPAHRGTAPKDLRARQIGAADVAVLRSGIAGEFNAVRLGATEYAFLIGNRQRGETVQIVHPALGEHVAAAVLGQRGCETGVRLRGRRAVHEAGKVAAVAKPEAVLLRCDAGDRCQSVAPGQRAGEQFIATGAVQPNEHVLLRRGRRESVKAFDRCEFRDRGTRDPTGQTPPECDHLGTSVNRRTRQFRPRHRRRSVAQAEFQQDVVFGTFVEDARLVGAHRCNKCSEAV